MSTNIRGWIFFLLIAGMPPSLKAMGAGKASTLLSLKRSNLFKLTPKQLQSKCRVLAVDTLCHEKIDWAIKEEIFGCGSRNVRISTKNKRSADTRIAALRENFSPLIAASVALKAGKKAQKKFIFPLLEGYSKYEDKAVTVEQVFSAGPVSLELDKKGCLNPRLDVWPSTFDVSTRIVKGVRSKRTFLSKGCLYINPYLILPLQILR